MAKTKRIKKPEPVRMGRPPAANPRLRASESPALRSLQAAYAAACKPPLTNLAAAAKIARSSAREFLWMGTVPKSVAILDALAAALGCEVALVRKGEPRVKG